MAVGQRPDNAGVIAPPPLMALAVIVLGLGLDWLLRTAVLGSALPLAWRIVIGILLIVAGLGLAVPARSSFKSLGTNVEPWKPTTLLVTTGLFGRMRNPMYVGGTLFLLGLAILVASDWMLVLTIIFVPVMHFGVVRREERYLLGKFGESYRQYMDRVRRYGLF